MWKKKKTKKKTQKTYAHGSSFHKMIPRIFLKPTLASEDQDRGEEM